MALRLKRRMVATRANYPTGKPRQHAPACKYCGGAIPRKSEYSGYCSRYCYHAKFAEAYR